MLQQDSPEDYVITTGETHSVRNLVKITFAAAGLPWKEHVVVDRTLLRPAEVEALQGDSTKARARLGRRPTVSFRELVEMIVRADLEECQRSPRAAAR